MSIAEAYLAHLHHLRPTTLDVAALASLLAAHQQAIPFENVASFLGDGVSLLPADVARKLLGGGRGGYCLEHQAVSFAALRELGFECELFLARVYMGPGGPGPLAQTHGGVVVTIDGREYIYDAGCGKDTPRMPICLSQGHTVQTVQRAGKEWAYRVVAPDTVRGVLGTRMGVDIECVVEGRLGGTWSPMYGLTRRPVEPADIDPFNWYISTCPRSFFTTRLFVARQVGDALITGFGRAFKRRRGDGEGAVEAEVKSATDVDFWLRQQMRLALSDGEVERVWARLCEVEAQNEKKKKKEEEEETDQL